MGLLDGLRRKKNKQRLVEEYVRIYEVEGIPRSQAREMAAGLVELADKESRAAGTDSLPADYGNQLLLKEVTDPRVRGMLARARSDGATDEDITAWWNLPDLDRRMMLKNDENLRITGLLHFQSEGMTQAEAENLVRRCLPIYEDLGSIHDDRHEDSPLPLELKLRVNAYRARRIVADPHAYQMDMEGASSFNALIRSEIRAGRL